MKNFLFLRSKLSQIVTFYFNKVSSKSDTCFKNRTQTEIFKRTFFPQNLKKILKTEKMNNFQTKIWHAPDFYFKIWKDEKSK